MRAFDWERHLRGVDNDEATGETLAAIDHALIELARLRRIEAAARAYVGPRGILGAADKFDALRDALDGVS
jgi:hypothetical protein